MLSDWILLLLSLGLVLLAILLFSISSKLKRETGMPEGQIIYKDTGKWGKPAKPLYDSDLGLTGKPDYLIRKRRQIIPVEVKSTWAPSKPYDSHKMQLAAYWPAGPKLLWHPTALWIVTLSQQNLSDKFQRGTGRAGAGCIGQYPSAERAG